MIDNAVYKPSEADITFIGLEYYGTCPAKGKGPDLIRQALNSFSSYDMKNKKDAFNEIKMSDLGNIKAENYEELKNKTLKKLETVKGQIIMMGGEHLVSLPVIEHLSKKEKFNVLIFDAHADYFNEYEENKNSYATVSHRISELVNKVYIAGVRDLTLNEVQALKNSKNTQLINIEDINKLEKGKWYVSIDLDVLDPSECPEVSTPIPLGYSMTEFVKVLNDFCVSHDIIGLDIVELTANKKGVSSINAGGIIMNYLKRRCD